MPRPPRTNVPDSNSAQQSRAVSDSTVSIAGNIAARTTDNLPAGDDFEEEAAPQGQLLGPRRSTRKRRANPRYAKPVSPPRSPSPMPQHSMVCMVTPSPSTERSGSFSPKFNTPIRFPKKKVRRALDDLFQSADALAPSTQRIDSTTLPRLSGKPHRRRDPRRTPESSTSTDETPRSPVSWSSGPGSSSKSRSKTPNTPTESDISFERQLERGGSVDVEEEVLDGSDGHAGSHASASSGAQSAGHDPGWNINSIMTGDGSTFGDITFEKGRLYASANSRGGPEHYWPIHRRSLRVAPLSSSTNPTISTRHVTEESLRRGSLPPAHQLPDTHPGLGLPARGFRASTTSQSYADRAIRTAELYPGASVTVGGPGARASSSSSRQLQVLSAGRLHSRSSGRHDCLVSAVVNAVDSMLDLASARLSDRALRDSAVPLEHIGSTSRALQSTGLGLNLRQVPVDDRSISGVIRAANRRRDGYVLVRLQSGDEVDHVVTVDARRGLILEGAEEYPLRLSEETLRLCGGGPKARVTEV
ncbi:hypothetical protein FGB62_98g054 [Gracilaria domingensis]|nr:hypothetical protein FGB62_98g054 [Gracilaria domingensis]